MWGALGGVFVRVGVFELVCLRQIERETSSQRLKLIMGYSLYFGKRGRKRGVGGWAVGWFRGVGGADGGVLVSPRVWPGPEGVCGRLSTWQVVVGARDGAGRWFGGVLYRGVCGLQLFCLEGQEAALAQRACQSIGRVVLKRWRWFDGDWEK